jgi:hypothetical protein
MRSLLRRFFWIWIFSSAVLAGPRPSFEIVAEFEEAPGNLTVTPDGRIIMSLHQFYEPWYSVVEVLPDSSIVPFPNAQLNKRGSSGGLRLDSVLGIQAASNGTVWMLDNGLRSGVTPKLVAWDTRNNKLHRVINFPESVAPANAFLNDLAIDNLHNLIFISDPAGGSNAALIVVNLQSGATRRVLEGDQSVRPENVELVIDNRPLQMMDQSGKLVRPKIGVNPIAEDANNEWVYFGPMHGTTLYRIRAEDLADEGLDQKVLASRVERFSRKPISDGITMDKVGNIYLGELAENAIGMVTRQRSYRRLVKSPQLSWVDSLSFGPDGRLYAVVNRLHLSAQLNGGKALSKPPYYLVRMTVPDSG